MADDASTNDQAEGTDDEPGRRPGDDDELRRRFREALAHKQAGGPHGSGGHPGAKNPAPSSNDKRQRTFRRKSG
ncbi:MAG TPA: DUF5302 domain-containing protein [Acidothermaceae bacterium]|jgi:hypothetical protein|nr:DUF5302 domain-containing protein [Acidothermaceae bacterium]